jgi:transglutaminase/protease-like cytokinesis protein 3
MNKKRTSALLSAVIAAIMLFTGCGSPDAEQTMSELVPNVITKATDEGVSTDTPPITDANGSTYTTVETKTSEELASIVNDMMTAPATEATTVMSDAPAAAGAKLRTYEDKYAYNTLTDDEKALYANIVSNASSLRLRVDVQFQGVTKEMWDKVYGMVYNQEPQLFWMSPKLSLVGRIYYRNLDTDSIKSMQAEIDATVSKLLADMQGLSDFDKINYMNDYLVLNSTFLNGADADGEANYNSTIYNAFAGGTSKQGDVQCVGYAHAVQYLCDRVGIDCMVVTGVTDAGVSHAWNKVKIDGEWYNFDTTWDDPVLDTPNFKNIRHLYVLVPDAWIIGITHLSENEKFYNDGTSFKFFTPPPCTATAMNWFKQKGEVYSTVDSAVAELTSQLENAAANGLRTTEIMCSDKAVYDAVRAQMRSMQDSLKAKYSNVKGISDKCQEAMLVVELDVIYN